MTQHDVVHAMKEDHKEMLFTKPNVVGVGVGYKESHGKRLDELSIVVLVRQKVPETALSPQALVPPIISGVRTDVVAVGELRAFQARTDRWRPAPGGVSLGHYQITAGTLGSMVRDSSTGELLILSNNHVLANSNDAQINDPILQPGPTDGGQVATDTIARLERFCPIEFSEEPGTCGIAGAVANFANFLAELTGSQHRLSSHRVNQTAVNLVDAAVAKPVDVSMIRSDILEIGVISGALDAFLGMSVRKSGRTTAFTTGEVTVLNATVSVSYGVGKTARFENQIVTSPMSEGGDSGSLLVSSSELKAVGLLFAGSTQSTIHNPIQAVMDCLNITL